MFRIQQLFVFLAIISLSNAHLALMQGFTWIEMAANNSSRSFLPALTDSIKVETKCDRCCELEKSHNQESERSIQWESKLVANVQSSDGFSLPNFVEIPNRTLLFESLFSVSVPPETPPPRLCS